MTLSVFAGSTLAPRLVRAVRAAARCSPAGCCSRRRAAAASPASSRAAATSRRCCRAGCSPGSAWASSLVSGDDRRDPGRPARAERAGVGAAQHLAAGRRRARARDPDARSPPAQTHGAIGAAPRVTERLLARVHGRRRVHARRRDRGADAAAGRARWRVRSPAAGVTARARGARRLTIGRFPHPCEPIRAAAARRACGGAVITGAPAALAFGGAPSDPRKHRTPRALVDGCASLPGARPGSDVHLVSVLGVFDPLGVAGRMGIIEPNRQPGGVGSFCRARASRPARKPTTERAPFSSIAVRSRGRTSPGVQALAEGRHRWDQYLPRLN